MKITTNQVIAIAFLILATFIVYWLFIRPSSIRASCHDDALQHIKSVESDASVSEKLKGVDILYDLCLKKSGL